MVKTDLRSGGQSIGLTWQRQPTTAQPTLAGSTAADPATETARRHVQRQLVDSGRSAAQLS